MKRTISAVTILAVGLIGLGADPARAVASPTPVITFPGSSNIVEATSHRQYEGPIIVDYSNAPSGSTWNLCVGQYRYDGTIPAAPQCVVVAKPTNTNTFRWYPADSLPVDSYIATVTDCPGGDCTVSPPPIPADSVQFYVEYGPPVLVSPSPGSTVCRGFQGPYTVDMGNTRFGQIDFSVDDWNSILKYEQGMTDLRHPYGSPPPRDTGKHTIIMRVQERTYTFNFNVGPTSCPFTAGVAETIDSTFYPIKRDGYKDRTYVDFSITNYRTTGVIKIYNSMGRVVFGGTKLCRTGSNGYYWNGKNTDGVTVRAGKYVIAASFYNHYGAVARVTTAVRVNSGP